MSHGLFTRRKAVKEGLVPLSQDFQKDIHWFQKCLPHSNGIYLIHTGDRSPIRLFVDACVTNCESISQLVAYHTRFLAHSIEEQHSICHLEALNMLAAIQHWAPRCRGHGFSTSTTAIAIFQARKGRDAFIQACARELWLSCAECDITLWISRMPGEDLTLTAGAVSCWHTSQHYIDHVN